MGKKWKMALLFAYSKALRVNLIPLFFKGTMGIESNAILYSFRSYSQALAPGVVFLDTKFQYELRQLLYFPYSSRLDTN